MTTKTVKISEENYKWLCEIAGNAQAKEKKVISLDEALDIIKNKMKGRLSELSGSWSMSDDEAKKFRKNLRNGWNTWTKSG